MQNPLPCSLVFTGGRTNRCGNFGLLPVFLCENGAKQIKTMLKYLPALIIAASQIPSVNAQQSQCLNYWVNPTTGVEECLNLQQGLPPTPVVNPDVEVQPPDTPKGYKFLAQNEFGDRYFIKLGNLKKRGRRTYSNARIRTHPKFGEKKIDFYSIWCDRRQFRTLGVNSVAFYGGSEGSIGYEIWKAACVREK